MVFTLVSARHTLIPPELMACALSGCTLSIGGGIRVVCGNDIASVFLVPCNGSVEIHKADAGQ